MSTAADSQMMECVGSIRARALGRTEVRLTALGFGAATIGRQLGEESDRHAHAALEAAWRLGIRYFDTAPWYGRGLSELRVGSFVRNLVRDDFVLSSKVGRILRPRPGRCARSRPQLPRPPDAVGRVLEREGRIDILVNNAGIAGLAAPVVDYPADEWRRILSIDLDEADIRAKMALYIRTGVPLVWLVDPRTQTIEEIRPAGADSGGASVVTRLLRADAGDVLEASDVLPAFRLSVQEVFD